MGFEFCKENKQLMKMNLRMMKVRGKEKQRLIWVDGSEGRSRKQTDVVEN